MIVCVSAETVEWSMRNCGTLTCSRLLQLPAVHKCVCAYVCMVYYIFLILIWVCYGLRSTGLLYVPDVPSISILLPHPINQYVNYSSPPYLSSQWAAVRLAQLGCLLSICATHQHCSLQNKKLQVLFLLCLATVQLWNMLYVPPVFRLFQLLSSHSHPSSLWQQAGGLL